MRNPEFQVTAEEVENLQGSGAALSTFPLKERRQPGYITRPFGTLLSFGDGASLVVSVISQTASIICQMASLQTPILHRDISIGIGSIIHHGDACQACLIDFGTAVHAPTGSFTAATLHSMPATSTFMARSVLEGGAYTLSLELSLESLMSLFSWQ